MMEHHPQGEDEDAEAIQCARRCEEELAQLELLLESAPVGFAFLDRDLRFVRINRYLADYNGLSVEEHLGRSIHEVIPDKARHIAPILRQVIETAKPAVGLELPMQHPKAPGQIIHFLSSYYPARNRAGEVEGVGVTVMDITKRHQMEEALRASDEATNLIIDTIPASIAVIDERGVITRVNKAWERFRQENGGDPAKTGVDASYLEVCRRATGAWSEGASRCYEGLRAVLAGKCPGFDLEYPCPSGEVMRWFLLRLVPMPQGRGALAAHIDITEVKRLQEELRQRTSELDATFRALPDLYFRVDAEGTYLDIRAGKPSDLYLPVKELLGKRIRDVLPPDAVRQVEEAIEETLETGKTTRTEYPLVIAGEPQVFEMRLSPLGNRQAVAVVRNITEQKRTNEALRASEENYRMLVERISDWIWEVDAEGVFTYSSPKVRDLLGYDPAEVVGKTPFDFMPVEEGKRVRQQFRAVAARREAFSGQENHYYRKDGSIVILEASATPIFDESGRFRGYRGIDRDITAKKRMAEAERFLAKAMQALSGSLDATALLATLARLAVPILGDWCIAYALDETGNAHRTALEYANPARADLAKRLLAMPTPPIHQAASYLESLRKGHPLVIPTLQESHLHTFATSPEHLEAVREIGATSALVVPMRARERLLGIIALFMAESGRSYDGARVTLATTLAERAAGALENARLYEEATAANAAKDQFLAVLSHELRNPLAPVLAGAAVLKRVAPQEERVQRTVAIIERNVKLQARLINDLLDLSRVKRGKMRLQRVPTLLDNVVQAAVQTQQRDAEEAGLDLQVQLQPGLWVHGDPDRLQQVVMNLLSNAIKFTPSPGQVRVILEKSDSMARITVSDTGIGISPDLLPQLFGIFQQGEVAGRRAAGLGIGLSLVKSITELHGGNVRVESDGPGTGSRFTVELPLIPSPGETSASQPPQHPTEARVLLIEDNPDTCALLKEELQALGHTVRAVATGEAALEWLQHEHPEVIVTDIGLPGIDGYEFLRRARELPSMRAVPAFAITGYDAPPDLERAREAGFNGYLTKPVDIAILDRCIRQRMAPEEGPAAAGQVEERPNP